jgi:hypothetical protein
MKKSFKLLLTIVLVTALGFAIPSCTKKNFDMDRLSDNVVYTGSFALPIAYSDIAFYKVIDLMDSTIELRDNDDGYLSLYYESYVESKPVQDLLNVGNQTYSREISLSDIMSKATRSEASVHYSTSEVISFTLFNTDAEIDSITLKSATFEYSLTNTIGKTTKIVLEFPSITKNGRIFKDSITLMPSESTFQKQLSLDGYTIDLTQTSQRWNEIPINVSIDLNFATDAPPTSGTLGFSVGINELKYSKMFGYFGYNELFFQSDTISIKLFKDNPKYYMDRFYFNDPKLTVHYWNSYGVPSMFYFTELNTYVKKLETVYNIMPDDPSLFPMSELNPFHVKHSERYGTEALDSVFLDKNNSNLDQIVPNKPIWVHFKALAATNPGVYTHNNFITEDSKLRSLIDVEFPLWGYLYKFTYTDTVDVDIANYTNNLPISRMAVLLTLENRMPVEAFAQIYLTDENYHVLDSLIDNPNSLVLEAAPVDANGRIINKVNTQTKMELTQKQISDMSNCKHLLIKLYANTDGALQGRLMKIYREYGAKANIGIEVDLDVESTSDIDNIGAKNLTLK